MGTTFDTCKTTKNIKTEHRLDQISPTYEINEFKEVKNILPYYPHPKYTCLADLLLDKHQKYIDEVYPNARLLNTSIKWKRLTEVFPQAKLHINGNFDFNYQPTSLRSDCFNIAFFKMVEKLKTAPNLIRKIFPNTERSSAGFYVLLLCLNGNVEKPIEVIIDDMIPVNSSGLYIFAKPLDNIVWAILLEKAWAKVMGSYQDIEYLSSQNILEETVGIPSADLLQPDYYLASKSMFFPAYTSQYLKFALSESVEITLTIWQQANYSNMQRLEKNSGFILELIKQEERDLPQYLLHSSTYKSLSNKCILQKKQGQFLKLDPGNYVLHVYNRNDFQCTSNLIIYSSQRVDLHVRRESQFKQMKHRMIKNLYKTQHNLIQPVQQTSELALRFIWRYHRGILCLKNTSPDHEKTIRVSILKEFQHWILFEDENDTFLREKTIKSGEHCFFIFVRKRDEQLGKFYLIQTLNCTTD